MNAPEALIAVTAERVFREVALAPEGDSPVAFSARWAPIAATGLDRILVPEAQSGFGVDLGDVVAMLRLAGRHAIAVPLMEAMVARWLMACAGFAEADGIVVLATPVATPAAAPGVVAVPYGRAVAHACCVDRSGPMPMVIVFAVDPGALERGEDLAGEPRDRMTVPPTAPRRELAVTTDRVDGLCALLRAAQMQGAMEQALAIALEHANTRQQFGRPIGQFQAVQQMLALVATQIASVTGAVDGGTAVMREDAMWIGGALAKARASEAAAQVNAVVHQVTAAMGFTREFPLQMFTRRLWAWRDEFGTEQAWHARIGARVLGQGGAALWPFLVAPAQALEIP